MVRLQNNVWFVQWLSMCFVLYWLTFYSLMCCCLSVFHVLWYVLWVDESAINWPSVPQSVGNKSWQVLAMSRQTRPTRVRRGTSTQSCENCPMSANICSWELPHVSTNSRHWKRMCQLSVVYDLLPCISGRVKREKFKVEGMCLTRALPAVCWGGRLGRPLYTMAWPAALSIDGPRLPLRRSLFSLTHALRNGSTFMLFMWTFHAWICIFCDFPFLLFPHSFIFVLFKRMDIF